MEGEGAVCNPASASFVLMGGCIHLALMCGHVTPVCACAWCCHAFHTSAWVHRACSRVHSHITLVHARALVWHGRACSYRRRCSRLSVAERQWNKSKE